MKRKHLVILSGAGVSAESGLKTFRDHDGLWENYRIEEVATPEAWRADPDLVTRFYNGRRKEVTLASPNKAHLFFAQLEQAYDVTIITQNIDDLHERAGSTNVLHLHGNIRFSKSSGPNAEKEYFPIEGNELRKEDVCPAGYRLRPHVVWFGEAVPAMEDAIEQVMKADILIVCGTSLAVYPAAGLLHYAPSDARKILIDPKADEMPVARDIIKIVETAVNGIAQLGALLHVQP